MRRLLALTFLSLLMLADAAGAQTLRAGEAVARTCQDRPAAGAAGVASTTWTAERTGIARFVLDGGRGDWDLAVFDAAGTARGAGAATGAREQVDVLVRAGETLRVQGCRRSGPSEGADLAVDLTPYTPTGVGTARIVRVPFGLPTDHERLEATGLDVTHAHDDDGAQVVLYSDAEERRLRDAGFTFTTVVEDLRAQTTRTLRADALRARSLSRTALPSGNPNYRLPADYDSDLKELAEANPGLVKPVTIGQSLEGRPIPGVEIAEGVDRTDDGRPILAVLGLHHAREWPSGEMPMEFAIDLARRYRAGDPRVTDVLRRVRVLILPKMNPDGFEVSRNSGQTPADNDDTATAPLASSDRNAYKRKNCRPTNGDADAPCATRVGSGVDLNRNYGAYYGGVGTSTVPTQQNFRGSGPYSEPESEAFHRVSQTRPIVTVISHHTFTDEGVWLRQPGFCQTPPAGCQSPSDPDDAPGPYDIVPDEEGLKALGDAMGQATGWRSALGWDIGEITGATEDWNYFAAGAYGYTPEQRGPNFHPDFETAVVEEYDGTGPSADGGVGEALLRAAEQAGDPRRHSVLTGTGPAGATLRLVKEFSTATSLEGLFVADRLDLSVRVPANGRFEWHVNPSSRPLAGRKEAYLLRCEASDGRLLATREVVVDRGQRLDVGDACAAGGTVAGGTPPAAAPLPSTGTPAARRRRPVLVISRRAVRARTINRQRRMSIALRVDGTLRNLRVRFVDRRNRTYLSGSLRTLSRDRTLTLRRVRTRGRALRPGRHRVLATAVGRDGVVVRATRRVTVRR